MVPYLAEECRDEIRESNWGSPAVAHCTSMDSTAALLSLQDSNPGSMKRSSSKAFRSLLTI